MQAVSIFFAKLGIGSLIRPFGVLVIIGVLCGLASWSTGPAEGMRRVEADGHLSPWWGRTNRRGAPTMVLIVQATLGSLLALALVFVNNINTYYWMLTALVAQTFLIMYFFMYISVIRLRITKPDVPRPFKIPGGPLGLTLVVGAGVVGALFTFFLGFIPATHLSEPGTVGYIAVMAFGMIVIIGAPFLLHRGLPLNVDAHVDPNLPAPGRIRRSLTCTSPRGPAARKPRWALGRPASGPSVASATEPRPRIRTRRELRPAGRARPSARRISARACGAVRHNPGKLRKPCEGRRATNPFAAANECPVGAAGSLNPNLQKMNAHVRRKDA